MVIWTMFREAGCLPPRPCLRRQDDAELGSLRAGVDQLQLSFRPTQQLARRPQPEADTAVAAGGPLGPEEVVDDLPRQTDTAVADEEMRS